MTHLDRLDSLLQQVDSVPESGLYEPVALLHGLLAPGHVDNDGLPPDTGGGAGEGGQGRDGQGAGQHGGHQPGGGAIQDRDSRLRGHVPGRETCKLCDENES